ncbi:hypothetical protein F4777DRAFT_576844 [Nemania sp. FL0916]|nr:hypothetical protein F4777DRAFT_576844 [Nemania sp. FL0916]
MVDSKLRGTSKIKLVPGIYVVGGSKTEEMKATSKKYKDESKALLLDGYRQTRGEKPFYVPSE